MSFGASYWFIALLVVPFVVLLFARAEGRAAARLREFASAQLLPNLVRTVNPTRRKIRFALILLGLALAIIALAKPRWGYTYEDVKRKGLDLIFAVDTSRSMLSNDVQPNRLLRVKLTAQDLLNELQGDRVGLIAFAGRAFLQAPLTIDYDAAVEAINDLDTNTIPEGGSNISEAINLAVNTFGKSAIGNRALIIFTDGEELSGDAVKAAKAVVDAGVRIFTIGVGTPEGSLIPLTGEGGATAFVKDSKGQVVKSKLDEKKLKEMAENTGGFYLHLEDGPRTMKQLFAEGLGKMQTGEIDDRMSRRPIERYHWPLGAALLALAASYLIRERKRVRASPPRPAQPKRVLATAATLFCLAHVSLAAGPGLDAYRQNRFAEAYQQFEKTLKEHPNSHAADKIQFDAGAAAYEMGEYNKALEWFSQSLLSPDKGLQEKSHYNIGRTLEQRADKAETDEKALKDLMNAQSHYEEALKLNPNNERAKANLEAVKKKIENLKKKPKEPPPSQQDKKQDQKKEQKKDEQKDQQDQKQDPSKQEKDQQKEQDQKQQEQKDQPGSEQQKSEKDEDKSQSKSDPEKQDSNKKDEPKPGQSPSPTPGGEQSPQNQSDSSPSPSAGDQGQSTPSPTPSGNGSANPSPSPGTGEEQGASPTPTASASPGKKFSGEVKGAGDENSKEPAQTGEAAPVEAVPEGQMSEKQAELLLRSMKAEEERVQLDERKAARRVYNDW